MLHLAQSIESKIMDGFWCSGCLNDCIDLPFMIRSFPGGATSSMVAKKWTKKLSPPFEELQGWNLEFKLITPKTISGTYFKTNLSHGLKFFVYNLIYEIVSQISYFQSLNFKVWTLQPYWGQKAPSRAPGGPKGPQVYAAATRRAPSILKFTDFAVSGCLYNCINQPDTIGSFASGDNVSLVAKILLNLAQSKWPYWSPLHDRIISRWRYFLHGGQKMN